MRTNNAFDGARLMKRIDERRVQAAQAFKVQVEELDREPELRPVPDRTVETWSGGRCQMAGGLR